MRTACLAAIAGIVTATATGALAQPDLELAVKATYLVKLAPFVDWPTAASGEATSPLAICVAGRDPFGALLDRAAAGQKIADHPLVVRRIAAVTPDPPCQILFLGGSATQSVRGGLQVVREAPVLTVTDGAASPGVIDFVLDQGHVKFRIDDAAAAEHGLTIRSQLLNLAVSVTPRKVGR
jgi:hypothetical protein